MLVAERLRAISLHYETMSIPLPILSSILQRLDSDSLSQLKQEHTSLDLLRAACSSDQLVAVEMLLQAGIVPDSECLAVAVAYDRRETIRILLATGQLDPSEDGNYALKTVAKRCDTETVSLLLEDDRVDVGVLDDENICSSVRELINKRR